MLRIVDKTTGRFIRDDFVFDPETEVGLSVEPASGFNWPRWDYEQQKWVEGAV